ncbi:MAG: hypothetical protein ACF8R9_00710 [Phycisphaerales bacterium JB054]
MSDPTLTLAIEASNPSAAGSTPGVVLGRVTREPQRGANVELLGVELLRSTARHDDDLLPAVERLWSSAAESGVVKQRREIGCVAVSVGPGGFTGLRVAIAAGKMIAEVLGARCVAVPSACVVARRVAADFPRPFAVLLASKRETTIATVFADGAPGDAKEIDAAGLAALGVGGLIADSFLPESIAAEAARLGLRLAEPVFDPAACLEASADLPSVDPASLAAIYGREPEAVRKWRELHGPA